MAFGYEGAVLDSSLPVSVRQSGRRADESTGSVEVQSADTFLKITFKQK